MIEALGHMLDDYPGDPNHTRCFNHIIALVAKRLVRQFDAPKAGANAALDEAEEELRSLAEGIDIEELLVKGVQDEGEDDEDDNGDNDDGRTEDEMSAEEHADLDASTRPVRLLLVKVGSLVLCNGINLNGKDGIASEDRIQSTQPPLHYHCGSRCWTS